MSPSQANSQERFWESLQLQQAIDSEIKSLEESIRELRLRRNALSPVSYLPPEVFAAIFSFLCLPALEGEMSDHHQARLLVSHVCHEWREIALNQPFLWSNIDFTNLTLAGTTEILARAKSVPVYLEARLLSRRSDIRFSAFQKVLQARLPDVCHLSISAALIPLHKTLGGLVSPAPTLEYLSLFSRGGYQNTETGDHLFISDSLFSGSSPRLSRLKLFNCEISWTSTLLKCLKHLEIRSPNTRPKLAAWLDALDAMSQLKTLILHSASPITPQGDLEHNATLPSLTHLEILASPADCAVALAHLYLPALTALSITASLHLPSSHHIRVLLPHLERHAHGPQDTRPLQSMLFRSDENGAKILAWTLPDIDVVVQDPPILLSTTTLPPRMALFFKSNNYFDPTIRREIIDAALPALPLSSLITLLAQDSKTTLDKRFWIRQAPTWPLLRRVQLAAPAQDGFGKMLLDRNNGGPPLLPLLTGLVLVGVLSYDWTSALRKRVEQSVPLERLDLRMCVTPSHEDVLLLSEIVVDVLGPDNTGETMGRMIASWEPVLFTVFSEEMYFESEYSSYTYEGSEER
jgi:hypothetical protein